MLELNQAQFDLLQDMAKANPYQIIVRKPRDPAKEVDFIKLNTEVDEIIAAGFVQDVTAGVRKPAEFKGEFRVIGITVLGQSLFTQPGEEGAAARA